MRTTLVLWVLLFSTLAVAATLVHSIVITVPAGKQAPSRGHFGTRLELPHAL